MDPRRILMKTALKVDGEFTILEISGYLDFENSRPIAESIGELYAKNQGSKILIDLEALEFVGSSGISTFVKSIKIFNKMKIKPVYFGVKSEFIKLFRLFEGAEPFEITDSFDAAKRAALARFQLWQGTRNVSNETH
jgi:anti-sigma B factor antagonist